MGTLTTIREVRKDVADASRLYSVQALRAVAALLVVWAHSIDAAEQSHSLPVQIGFFHWENFGASGLDIFFVISGFIVSLVAARAASKDAQIQAGRRSWGVARSFLIRRITRIFPLYWILTLVVITEGEIGRFHIHWQSVAWMQTLFLLPSLQVPLPSPLLSLGWSLVFEFYFYWVLAIFLLLFPRYLIRNTAILFTLLAAVGIVFGIRHPLLILWMNPMILEFVFGCMAGMLYLRAERQLAAKRSMGKWVAFLGALLLAATIFTGYGQASEADVILAGHDCWLRVAVWGIPAALLVGGTVFWNPAMRSVPARLLVFLGDASYSIYLCTIPARSVAEHFWRSFFGRLGADMGVLLCALFCTAIGILCYLCIERPLMRITHNWWKPMPFGQGACAAAG
jgi:exopolysaccharide production protein ExoZ